MAEKEDKEKKASRSQKILKTSLKTFLFVFILIFLVSSSYVSLPFLTLYNLKNAIEEKNFEKFSQNIDHKKLQTSIKAQIYQHINDDKNDNFKKFIARNFAKGYVDKAIEEATQEQNLFNIIIGKKKEEEKFLWGIFDFLKVIKKIDFLGIFDIFKFLGKLDFFGIFSEKKVEKKIESKPENIKFGFENLDKFFLKFSKDKKDFKIILIRNKFSWKVSEIILPKEIFKEKI